MIEWMAAVKNCEVLAAVSAFGYAVVQSDTRRNRFGLADKHTDPQMQSPWKWHTETRAHYHVVEE
jgi:hypothetical protein